jgi:hypothetical protein
MQPAKAFLLISDDSHGWLAVPSRQLKAIGLKPSDISDYSYYSTSKSGFTMYYLEEDCDAPLFLDAFKAKFGFTPAIKEKHTPRTQIRSFDRVLMQAFI